MTYIYLRQFGIPNCAINKTIQRYFFKNSFSFGIHYIIGVFYFTIDNQLVYYYSGSEALAIYQAVFKLIFIFLSIGELLNNVFIPYLSSKFHYKNESFKSDASISNKTLIILGLILFMVINLFGEYALNVLYGDKFIDGYNIILPLSFVLLFRISTAIYAVFLTISDHQNIRVFIVVMSLLINVILNILLIPLYGYTAAAYVSMITHIFIVISYLFFSYRYLKSLLVSHDIIFLILITISILIIIKFYNSSNNYLLTFGAFFIWLMILMVFIKKDYILSLKYMFEGRYY